MLLDEISKTERCLQVVESIRELQDFIYTFILLTSK
jgi:hypothetical protein